MKLNFWKDYQQADLPPGLSLLYTNRTMGTVSKGLLLLFLPVFFYTKFNLSLESVIYLYIFSFTLMFFLVVPGAKMMNKIGMRRSIILSVPFSVLYYLSLFFIDHNVWHFAILAITFLNIARAFYWVPYHTGFAKFSHGGQRGRQMSMLTTISDFIQIFIPLLSSYLIVNFGFNFLFILILIIELLATIPIIFLSPISERFSWTWWETLKNLFAKKNRDILWSYAGDGTQAIVGLIFWPLFIWLLFNESYEAVGLISAGIILISIILRLIMGDYADKFEHNKVLKSGTILYAIGWCLKIFVATTFQVFIVSAYHNLAAVIMRTPFDVGMYDQAADWGHYADEFTVIREMALCLGRVVALGVILLLLLFLPINYAFLIAAGGSLLLNTSRY